MCNVQVHYQGELTEQVRQEVNSSKLTNVIIEIKFAHVFYYNAAFPSLLLTLSVGWQEGQLLAKNVPLTSSYSNRVTGGRKLRVH